MWFLHTSATLHYKAEKRERVEKGGDSHRLKNPSIVSPPPSLHAGQDELAQGQKVLWAGHERPINHTASPRGPARRTPPPRMPLSQQAAIPACTASLQH